MAEDVNRLLANAGIAYQFAWYLYDNVDELRRHIAKNNYDALFAVLPEGWRQPFRDDSTHEKIKQRIDVPSQCIQHDHTLPEVWVGRPHKDIQREDCRLARRIQQRYELCLWNLLAKLGWIPLRPSIRSLTTCMSAWTSAAGTTTMRWLASATGSPRPETACCSDRKRSRSTCRRRSRSRPGA